MASLQLVTLLMLLAVLQWVAITSGEQAKASAADVEEKHSVHIHTPPVQLLHRLKRSDPRLLQRSAYGRHSNHRHSIEQRRGPAHPSVDRRHTLAPDKPLIRRKRIRRDGSTPAITGNRAPALEQALVSHFSTAHRYPSADLLRDKSKPKRGHDEKTRRGKLVRRRERGRPLPHNRISLDSRHLSYGDHSRDRKRRRPVKRPGDKTLLTEHHHKQEARHQRPLVSGGYLAYRIRSGKTPISQSGKHPLFASSINDSSADEIHAHPVPIHNVRVLPHRQIPVFGSGERHHRFPVVQKSAGKLRHAVAGLGVSRSPKHDITTSRRHGFGPRIRTNDGSKKKSPGGRSKRSRGTKKMTRSSRRTLHRISQPLSGSPVIKSIRPHLARMKRRRIVRG